MEKSHRSLTAAQLGNIFPPSTPSSACRSSASSLRHLHTKSFAWRFWWWTHAVLKRSHEGQGRKLQKLSWERKTKHHGKKDRQFGKVQQICWLNTHRILKSCLFGSDPTQQITNGILGGFFTTCLKSMARRIASYNPSQEIIELKPPRIILPILLYGCFLKWWYPQNTPKWSFLVGKPMVVGYHHFRKPPYLAKEQEKSLCS